MMRALYAVTDWLGWLFCEAAFRTDCWGPMSWVYSLGCKLYGVRPPLTSWGRARDL